MTREHLAVVPAAFGDAGEVEKCANGMPSAVHHGHFQGPARDSKPHALGRFTSLGLDASLGMTSFHFAMSRPSGGGDVAPPFATILFNWCRDNPLQDQSFTPRPRARLADRGGWIFLNAAAETMS